MRRGLRDESGFAVATALAVIALMLVLGLAALAVADTQTNLAGRDRGREAAFNAAEAVLNNQMYLLSHPWPWKSAYAYPSSCTQSSSSPQCPSPSEIQQAMAGSDFNTASTWSVNVRDNLGSYPSYYQRSVVDAASCGGLTPCTWDSNGDGYMWVRAQATVRGQTAAIAALVRTNLTSEALPNYGILAGSFATSNNGNKVIADTGGTPLTVRCNSTGPGHGDGCLNYQPGQVAPANVPPQTGYTGPLLSSFALDELRARAFSLGTYYPSGCPASLTGAVVFIENGNCSYQNATFNSAATPGAVISNQGTLSFDANANYYGLVYSANGNPPPPASPSNQDAIVTIHANGQVFGAIQIDGPGNLTVGSSKQNFAYAANALSNLAGRGNVGIAPNGFRTLPNGQ